MHKVLTNYKATGDKTRGGYSLQWVGKEKLTYLTNPNGVHSWYKFKVDAVHAANTLNDYLENKVKKVY